MSKPKREMPPPHAVPQIVKGRLVRVCPECGVEVIEHTDADGMVSNDFREHYEAEHPVVVEPEHLQRFVLVSEYERFGPEASRELADIALDTMRKAWPSLDSKPIDWTLADRLDDLPEGVPVAIAAEVNVWALGGDDRGPRPRLYQRQGNELVAVKRDREEAEQRTREFLERSYELMERHLAAQRVLVARREHRLPQFKPPKDGDPDGIALSAAFDAWCERRKPLEAKITSKLDEADKRSWWRVKNGREDWREPLDEAIVAAGISEAEIEAERKRSEERLQKARETKGKTKQAHPGR